MNIYYLNNQSDTLYKEQDLTNELDRGIEDMETRHELPLDEAFKKITELREQRKNARN